MASENVTIRVDGTYTVPKEDLIVIDVETGKEADISNLSIAEINELIQTDCYLDLGNTIYSAIEEQVDISIT